MWQDDLFKENEGDNWFFRNRININNFTFLLNDMPLNIIKEYNLKPKSVLEIGCCNGLRLNELKNMGSKRLVGVDVSKAAIEDGKARFSEIDFSIGEIANLPISELFDLVIVNFVLHWVDRKNFFKAVSEIDKVINENGYLIIGDFLPDVPTKVRYHHRSEEIYTYKLDYSRVFTESNLYKLVATKTFSHDKNNDLCSNTDTYERGTCFLLRKNRNEFFYERL